MQAARHFNGIESLDHPVIAARDVDAARVSYERLGITVPPRGSHMERGTGNLCIMFPDDYIEIRGIIDASRFTMNLDKHLDQIGEGLMGVAFRTDDVQTSFDDMVNHGMRVTEPHRLTRNFEHPEGWTQPSFSLCVPEASDIERLMHVVVLQHLTPELIRRPDFLSHSNTCTGVSEMSGLIRDAGRVATKLSLLLGKGSVIKNADGVRCTDPTGQQTNLLLPHAYRARYGDIAKTNNLEMPLLAAMTLLVKDLGRLQAILIGNGLTYDDTVGGTIRVWPDNSCGVVRDFRKDPDS